MSAPIVPTDSPAVVALKREFRELDEREQQLKAPVPGAQYISFESPELQSVRARKAEIARQIFGL